MDPKHGLSSSLPFMKVIGKYGSEKGSYFGEENKDFKASEICKIDGPKEVDGVL